MPTPRPTKPPDSTAFFRLMNPELFYAPPRAFVLVGAAVVAVACANTARLVLFPSPARAREDAAAADDDE